jgi:hypothetical protein
MLSCHLLQGYCSRQGALVASCQRCLLRLPQLLLQAYAASRNPLPWQLLLLLPRRLCKLLLLLLWVNSRWLQLPMLRCLLWLHYRGRCFLLS